MKSKEYLNKNETERNIISKCVDVETGEITNEIYEGDKIISSENNEYINTHIINFKHNNGKQLKINRFTKVYNESFYILMGCLTQPEFNLAVRLINLISYDDCILRVNDKIANLKDISEDVFVSYDTVRKIMPKLIKKDILKKILIKNDKYKNIYCYIMNPYIFFKGNDILKDTEKMFSSSMWANL